MITIKKIFTNPFIAHPQLLEIWPEQSSKIMHEITLESLEHNEPDIFLIYKEDKVIGITGYFFMRDDVEYVDLRWHGIIKSERGRGYSKEAMILVLCELKHAYPEAQYIVEHVPLTDYSQYIVDHFVKLGYEKFNEPIAQDWTPNLIQGYKINIDQFLYEHTIANNDKIEQHYQHMLNSNLLPDHTSTQFVAEVVQDPDTQEYLIVFPPELMEKLDWQANDSLVWSNDLNGVILKNISSNKRNNIPQN